MHKINPYLLRQTFKGNSLFSSRTNVSWILIIIENSTKIKEIGKDFHIVAEDLSPNICFFLVLSKARSCCLKQSLLQLLIYCLAAAPFHVQLPKGKDSLTWWAACTPEWRITLPALKLQVQIWGWTRENSEVLW